MKIIYSILFVAAVSCTKSVNNHPLKPEKDVVIRISSGVEASGSTKAVVLNATALTDVMFLRKDVDGPTAPTTYATATAASTSRGTSGDITFATPELYNTNDNNAFFVAYWPKGTFDSDDKFTTWQVDGTIDILLADAYNAGKYTVPIDGKAAGTSMVFKHQLAQLEVICMADNDVNVAVAAVQDTWGDITKIELLGTNSVVKFTYSDPTKVTDATPAAIAMVQADYTTTFGAVTLLKIPSPAIASAGMFAPAAAGTTTPIKLKIYSTKVTDGVEIDIQLKDGADSKGFEIGKKHTATLVFKSVDKKIEVFSTKIEEWGTGYSGSGDIKPPVI